MMTHNPLSDVELEQIGQEFYVARTLAQYLERVDKKTRILILNELHNRQILPGTQYPVGKVSFQYGTVDDYNPDKQKLANDFGLEAVLAISDITQKAISEFLREQKLPPDPSRYLIKSGSHDVLRTPKIQPTLDDRRVEEIVIALLQHATANKKP